MNPYITPPKNKIMKGKFFRMRKFKGIDNEEILKLRKEIEEIQKEFRAKIKTPANRLKEIEEKCNHEFLFDCMEIEEDLYICPHCGKEINH